MIRTKKKITKIKFIAVCLILLMAISATGAICNSVLAVVTGGRYPSGDIQVLRMTSIGSDGWAIFEAPSQPGVQAGRMIGINSEGGFSDAEGDMGTMDSSDPAGTKFVYRYLTAGTYTFKIEVFQNFTIQSVSVGETGNATLVPISGVNNQYTFTVDVSVGEVILVQPSFIYTPPAPPPPSEDQPGFNPNAQPMQIWIDGVTGTGNDGSVIDETGTSPLNVYTGLGYKIEKGPFHANYQLRITEAGITIPAIRVEGEGIFSILPYYDSEDPDSVITTSIDKNVEGYSIFSQNNDSKVDVETMQGYGNGKLSLYGGVKIKGYFGVSDHDIDIGVGTASSKGITASAMVVSYAKLTMRCNNTLFEGIAADQKLNIDVIEKGEIDAITTLATGNATNNINAITVMSGGKADIKCGIGCQIGSFAKFVKYYDFVNFETTQMVEENKDVKVIDATNPGTNDRDYFTLVESNQQVTLNSLAKPLYTLSFNMMDEDGNIVEDTKVEHGTVKVITARGIGRGADGRGCNDFKIEQGTAVTIVLLPDYGYQFTSGSLNGIAMTTAQEGVATYQFNMPANHLHLNAVFTKVDDKIEIDNDEIVGATIGDLDGQINGTAEFKVETAQNVEEDKFKSAVDGAIVAGYTDLSLNQVVLKGNQTDAWRSGVTDLQEPMSVSLKVSEEMATELEKGKDVGILRDHNGEVTLLDAEYDKDTNELKFKTNGYSTYALVYSDTELKTKTTENSSIVKTGDMVLIVAIPTIALVVIANVMVTKRKRDLRK